SLPSTPGRPSRDSRSEGRRRTSEWPKGSPARKLLEGPDPFALRYCSIGPIARAPGGQYEPHPVAPTADLDLGGDSDSRVISSRRGRSPGRDACDSTCQDSPAVLHSRE